jgi:hypothetical protein
MGENKYPQFPIGKRIIRNYGDGNVYNGSFEIRGYVDDFIVVRWDSYRYEMIHKRDMFIDAEDGSLEYLN